METNETLRRLSHLFIDVGKALAIIAALIAVVFVAIYVWFGGASLTVVNETGEDLEDVALLVGHPEVGQKEIWRSNLSSGDSEWSYTFVGADRAVLRYVIEGKKIEAECLYQSGAAISARMVITAGGAMTCESDMRI